MKVEVEIMLIQLGKNVALLWILRILAVPVVLVLFAAGFLLNLLYGVVGAFGGLLSLLGGVAAMLALLDVCNFYMSPSSRSCSRLKILIRSVSSPAPVKNSCGVTPRYSQMRRNSCIEGIALPIEILRI